MIVVDTSVVAEMMRDEPDRRILAWADTVGRLHTTAITLVEIEYGIARLEAGRRKERVTAAASRVFGDFDDVILAFETRAARRYGEIVAARERRGRPIAAADGQITAICAAQQAALDTGNIGDFEDTGIDVINPWTL